jgi:hypothetical protein
MGDPPSNGSTIFATIGWTRKSRNALVKSVAVKRGITTSIRALAPVAKDASVRPSDGVVAMLVVSIARSQGRTASGRARRSDADGAKGIPLKCVIFVETVDRKQPPLTKL